MFTATADSGHKRQASNVETQAQKAKADMNHEPTFVSLGKKSDDIDVRLSYKIVQLFSEGLYASPNKAIEELVANSFDAGALRVGVFLPVDFHDQQASIVVLDDGEGMDGAGLKRHWLIGNSEKRKPGEKPKGRQQIGKFGIGKLATYVLCNRLTHVSKRSGKYFSTSMNYHLVDERGDRDIEPKTPVKIALKELTEKEAQQALSPWLRTSVFKNTEINLFGKDSAKTWTFAILSDLKPKVHEIQRGVLEWVLRTALPLRDDFAIFQDGKKLESSHSRKGRIGKWTLGKEIKSLPKPASSDLEPDEDPNAPKDSPTRFGLKHQELGRVTGFAEAYTELLTGKSDQIGRSNGFFVYVHGRLVNVTDGHFGIRPDELRHGTFGRVRVVVYMDGLDTCLQSDRERIREGPILTQAQNLLRAIFNFVRPRIEAHDAGEEPGAKLAQKLAGSPASVSRRPIIEMAKAALEGKIRSRFIQLPHGASQLQRSILAELIEDRGQAENFVTGVGFSYDSTNDEGIAVYDAASGELKINGLHPFVGTFFDEFASQTGGLPLEVFALSEVLLESHLFQSGLEQSQIDSVMDIRDRLLRHVAQDSGRRNARTIATALRNARNDENRLEIEVVESFKSLGFDASRLGGKKRPDGIAKASLSPEQGGLPRRFNVTLEAKSTKDGGAVKTKTVGVSTIARHRDEFRCEHAVVIAPKFEHSTGGTESALAKEILSDRKSSAASGHPRTITAIHIDDLARLVELRPIKRLRLERFRDLFNSCSLPEECKRWIDQIEAERVNKPPYAKIVYAIFDLQSESRRDPVTYPELRNELKHKKPPISYDGVEDLKELCKAMAAMTCGEMSADNQSVELNQSPENVLAAIEAATKSVLDS